MNTAASTFRRRRAILIQPDTSGCVDDIEDTLAAFQRVVGGYIEQVGTEDVSIFLNEEGKIHGLPVNELATSLWWLLCPAMTGVDAICGPVLITGRSGPNNAPVPQRMIDLYRETVEATKARPHQPPRAHLRPNPRRTSRDRAPLHR